MTAERRLEGPASTPIVVDQALFGYRNGHRLLATSVAFEPHVLDVLNRTTDGTGAETLVGFDGYLSGFPLSDGRYVFTRTWKAPEAGRPGAVWTHAVFADLFNAGAQSFDYISLLRRPGPNITDLRDYESPIRLSASASETRRALDSDWTARLSALYADDVATIWFAAKTTYAAETEVVGVWAWHWPALRRRLSFCLGALSKRAVGGRSFDLLVVPAARKLTVASDLGPEPSLVSPAGTLVAADLRGEVPASFAQFVRFCGSETQRRTAVSLLSETWLLAGDPGARPFRALQSIAQRVGREYPEPGTMRRLKRALLVQAGRLPAPWSAADQLRVLLEPLFARSVRASDAPLETLLTQNSRKPTLLLQAAVAYGGSHQLAASAKSATVADVLGEMAESALAENAQPSWLPEVVEIDVEVAARVLRSAPTEARSNWADEFWALEATTRSAVSEIFARHVRLKNQGAPNVGDTLGWLAAYGEPEHAIAWFAATYTRPESRVRAAAELAAELAARSGDVRRGYVGSFRDIDLVDACYQAARKQPPRVKQMLLVLVEPSSPNAENRGLAAWAGALDEAPDSVAAAHLLRLAPRRAPTRSETRLAAAAYAHVWDALADSDWRAWDALGVYPANVARSDEWDRAMRVSRSFARQVAAWIVDLEPSPVDGALVDEVLNAASALSVRAASQLSAELDAILRPNHKSGEKKNKKTPVERARQMAADFFGFD